MVILDPFFHRSIQDSNSKTPRKRSKALQTEENTSKHLFKTMKSARKPTSKTPRKTPPKTPRKRQRKQQRKQLENSAKTTKTATKNTCKTTTKHKKPAFLLNKVRGEGGGGPAPLDPNFIKKKSGPASTCAGGWPRVYIVLSSHKTSSS